MIPDHFNEAGKSTSLGHHSVDHHVALHCIALHVFNEDGDHHSWILLILSISRS